METIIALSSGGLPSGVAVLRLSGPAALEVLAGFGISKPKPRYATFCTLKDDQDRPLDEVVVLYFPSPHSFTGEDVVELQCHGSQAVVQTILRIATTHKDVRLAMPGEFSQRAFENGKMDLTEIEGLGDLLDAKTESQRELAISRMRGGLSQNVEQWRGQIIDLLAEVEARLDFSDEGDVDDSLPPAFQHDLNRLIQSVEQGLSGFESGQIIKDGFKVALVGRPNVGKSTLLNALSQTDRAIVTDIPGTTRDVIEVDIDIGGQLFSFFDTAGIRQTDDVIELEGITRSYKAIERANLVIELVDSTNGAEMVYPLADWVIRTKHDLVENQGKDSRETLSISATTGEGMDALLSKLTDLVDHHMDSSETTLISHQRDRSALEDALSHLRAASDFTKPLEFIAEDLRQATLPLSRLIGLVDAEDILDRLFAGFCIGK
ncbi:tRNA uridine-5-carboxymethylaminomethyl(34) synthesis GTPase MnmE [Maritalea myrionectae]|uniref:tRNA uridine-5-carboxymethylaminomethyl(34) synthesis GTPase MnmE n=1 Tax=Maritalea myrionectae TaxID=454601 RepID=UPI0003F96DD3|nr:tRNA uridine-5-carboxymethylaminomethyl(34) synthesis GTPase MnmE [Maritalea myrionectae]